MAQRLRGHRVLLEPAARAQVRRPHRRQALGALLQPQEILEQVVVAVPDLFAIQPDDEEVGPLERLDHLVGILAAGDRIAQRRAELVQQRGVLQERAHRRGLPRDDILQEVIGEAAAGSFREHRSGGWRLGPASRTRRRRAAGRRSTRDCSPQIQPSVWWVSAAMRSSDSATRCTRRRYSRTSSAARRNSAKPISTTAPRDFRRATLRGTCRWLATTKRVSAPLYWIR